MKKLKQRKGMTGFAVLAAVFLWFGVQSIWDAKTHVGPGVWTYGSVGSDYRPDTDITEEVISEKQYKRNCYVRGGFFIFVGVIISRGMIEAWKKRNKLEKSWEEAISDPVNLQAIKKHPQFQDRDFLEWVGENHPDLRI